MTNKQENVKTRYFVQWDTHARHMCTVLCSLMEHQSLVDLAICCGTNTIHAHKCILAANSPYFREQLEKNAGTEQVIITGLDFAIVKSIVEFMYCGETYILDENLKYIIAAAKLFQMRGLQTLVSDNQDIRYEADAVQIPPPLFLPKKPKYPSAFRPPSPVFGSFKTHLQNDPYIHKKIKRKFVRTEAEKACAKEAAASRLALEALQKELATTTQMSSFVIEESCTETTVENFIPHTDETFIENINHMEGVPLQVVNYDELNNSILAANQVINIEKPSSANNAMQFGIRANHSKDKLKRMLGTNIPGNIEIMYRTNEGDFVNVTADVLQNLSGDALQYQIVDENGQIRELQEFQPVENSNTTDHFQTVENISLPCISVHDDSIVNTSSDLQVLNSNEDKDGVIKQSEINNKSMPQIINMDEQENVEKVDCAENENHDKNASAGELINISSSTSSTSSLDKNDNTTSSSNNLDESDPFMDIVNNKSENIPVQLDESPPCNVNQFLDLGDMSDENKENIDLKLHLPEFQEPPTKNEKLLDKEQTDFLSECSELQQQFRETIPDWCELNGAGVDNKPTPMLNTILLEADENEEQDSDVYKSELKKQKLSHSNESDTIKSALSIKNETKPSDQQHLESKSPRKTRSMSSSSSVHENKEVQPAPSDKPRRIMPCRKKKCN